MKLYPIKTPNLIQRLYPNYLWRFSSFNKEIYLTFDDGPTPEVTDFVLNQLDKYQAKATFFCIGKNILKHPDINLRIIQQGHKIGNHTNSHLNGWKTQRTAYKNDVLKADEIIENTVSITQKTSTKLFRPPYGKIKVMQALDLQKNGFKIVLWDVLSADFDIKTSNEDCLDNIINNTKEGSIVVLHDSKKAENKIKFALPKVLEYYTKKRYVFKSID